MFDIEINMVFRIQKGTRSTRWKCVEHPFFPGAIALISDHPMLVPGPMTLFDKEHIVHGSLSLEKAYWAAYNHT